MHGSGVATGHGFALLIMLGLLGLIATAFVALSALVVQETALQNQQMALAQARKNAHFALLEALAVLQQEAGPDAVVTARAQALGGDWLGGSSHAAVTAVAWTGVWPVAANGRAQATARWLVSGSGNPFEELTAEHSAELVAPRSVSVGIGQQAQWAAVRVPLVTLPENTGAYAWWVGDEGVKINIAAIEDSAQQRDWLSGQLAMPEYERLAALLAAPSVDSLLPRPQVATVAAVGGSGIGSGSGSTASTDGGGVLPRSIAAAAAESALDENSDAALRARILDISALGVLTEVRPDARGGYSGGLFHEVTFSSYGVLADPASGLRADYSLEPAAFPLDGEFARYADYRTAMEQPVSSASLRNKFVPEPGDLRRRYRIRAAGAVAQGEISPAVAPVLTDCYLLFNVHSATLAERDKMLKKGPVVDGQVPTPNEIVIHAGALVSLWNPYTSALVPEDMLLEIEGLPQQVQLLLQTGASRTVALRDKMRNASGSNSWWIELPYDDSEYPGFAKSWLPGRVHGWLGPNNFSDSNVPTTSTGGIFYQRNLNDAIWAQRSGVQYAVSTAAEKSLPPFRLSVPDATVLTVRLRLKPSGSSANWRSAPVLAEFSDVRFDRLSPAGAPWLDAASLRYQFGYRIRLEDPGSIGGGSASAWNKSAWLRRHDPRDSHHRNIGTTTGAGSSYYLPHGTDIAAHVTGSGAKGFHAVANNADLWNRSLGGPVGTTGAGSGLLQLEDAPLFELPRHDLLRVADLRHLHVSGSRAYAVGNRWGANAGAGGTDVNRVFDLGFFSGGGLLHGAVGGVPAAAGSSGVAPGVVSGAPSGGTGLLSPVAMLPHGRLLSVADAAGLLGAGRDSGRYLLLHGAFNINSFSPDAWRAVLAGPRYGKFEYIRTDHGSGEYDPARPTRSMMLGSAAGRFSQSVAETFDAGDYRSSNFYKKYSPDYHNPAVEPPTAYFRQGLVELSDPQLDLLALALVRRLEQRTSHGLPPFGSFAEFLGPVPLQVFAHPRESGAHMSVLEAAVIDVMGDTSLPAGKRLNHDAAGNIVWWDTPSFINGGDLWAQFAHYAAVRSDTFRIRAYGRSSSGGAEAWCEALVQRLPEPFVEGDFAAQAAADFPDEAVRNPASPFGRRFKLVSVRWLGRDEL